MNQYASDMLQLYLINYDDNEELNNDNSDSDSHSLD